MADLPNLDRLAKSDPDKLIAKQHQVLVIRSIAENTKGSFSEQTTRMASLGGTVPALLAHIDELYGENENLRKYAETTKYHQDKHAAAVRKLETVRAELVQLAGPLADEGRPNPSIEDLLIAIGGDLKYHRTEVERLRAKLGGAR